MNFYSLDGSKSNSNNLFENKPQIYERFNNVNIDSKGNDKLDQIINDNEEFVNIPTTKSNATDINFQCSDGYDVKGSTLGTEFKNINLNDCKSMCVSAGTDCIGFNFDTKTNACTLKKNASSMDNNNNSTLCIKKSAGNAGCKVNKNNSANVKAFNELDSIFNEQNNQNLTFNNASNPTSNPTYPMKIPVIENTQGNQNMDVETNNETAIKNESVLVSNNKCGANMGNNPSGVYVDLDCFMKNINVLQNRSDDMMIDLSLLLSNIKTCSYVKKNTLVDNKVPLKNTKMSSKQLMEQITSKINIPQPDTVQIKNVKADILVSSGTNSPSQVLEVAKEPKVVMDMTSKTSSQNNTTKTIESFSSDTATSNKSFKLDQNDVVFIIIIIIFIYFLILRK